MLEIFNLGLEIFDAFDSVTGDGTKITMLPPTGVYVRLGDAGTTSHSLDSNDDFMVTGELEVDGTAWFDGLIDADRTILAAADHSTGITDVSVVLDDQGTLVSSQTYRAGYYRYNVKSTTPSNPTAEVTGLEGVVGIYIPDEALTARGLYGRFYIDTDTDPTSTLRTGIGGEFSARASYTGGTEVAAEAGTAFVGARIWMAPYFSAATVANVNNFWGLWIYGEHATQRNADAAINVGEAGGGWTDILRVTPASDKDVNIVHVDVTGDPTISWDESADRFLFSHAIETIAVYIRTAEDMLYIEETDQVDPAGRWRFRADGDILYLEHGLTAAWATDEDWLNFDNVTDLITFSKGIIFSGTIELGDDVLFTLGADNDQVMLNRSTVLNADTGLASVLIGTPESQAIAANSLMISNVTASGDIAFYVNKAGASQMTLWFDGSSGDTAVMAASGASVDHYIAGTKVLDHASGAFAFQENTTVSSTGTLTITTPILASLYQASGGGLISMPASVGADTICLIGATQELDNKTLDASVAKGTWTASGTWTIPAVTLGGDITTDRWLSSATNTFFGLGVVGAGALSHVAGETGYSNSAFGQNSLFANTTGNLNSAFGQNSLQANTTGYQNSAFGQNSLQANTSGYLNSAFGLNSLFANTSGYYNSAFGMQSLVSNNTGYYNSAFGLNSLQANTSGIGNLAVGHQAGDNITTGNYNIVVGYDVDAPSATGDYGLNLGLFLQGTLPYADANYVAIYARDTGVGPVEVARAAGAADAYFQATLPLRFSPIATASLPATPVEGMITYDATLDLLTYRDASAWRTVPALDLGNIFTSNQYLDNTTTGSNADSPILYLRGNYWNDPSNVEVEAGFQLLAGADPYLRVYVDNGGATPASVAVIDIHDTVIACTNTGTVDLGSATNRFNDIYGDTLKLADTDASHFLTVVWNEAEAAASRTLNLLVNGGDRSVSLTGNLTVEAASLVNQDLTSDASPTFGGLSIASAGVIQGVGTGASGIVLKNLKNAAASALSGTQLDIEIDIGGAPYYFTVYPTKA